ncbi:titin-like isoform X2 [Pectinophora gossypiella]|nr:titin-like isoform X2 [Pectinophora gossypiella]
MIKKLIVNMSDNEDLLGDDLGDHSLADYNLGNEEEDQLLADDYDSGASQNVPTSVHSLPAYSESVDTTPSEYPRHEVQYNTQRIHYHLQPDTECVVPNITVEVPNQAERSTYAPYEPPPVFQPEHTVPPAIPASPMEAPQLVPTEMSTSVTNGDMGRERFVSERPPGAQRTPQIRDIPDSLDKVVVPRGGFGPRGRTVWRNPHYQRHTHYRRNNVHRGNFNNRPQFPLPQKIRPNSPQVRPDIRPNQPQIRPDMRLNQPQMRPEIPPNIPPEIPLNIRPELLPEIRPDLPELLPDSRPDIPIRPEFHPEMRPDLPLGPDMPPEGLMPSVPMELPFRPMLRPDFPRFPGQFRPNMDEPRPFNPNLRPNFEPFPYQRPFRPFPPMREVTPNLNHIPQVTIRHAIPPNPMGMPPKQEVRMLPVQLPPNLPPGGLQGKKVLINPHFKGNFQPPVEGPVKDIDDAAERFIAEQRNALARAANRKFVARRSPQRFIENTTIEIENELAAPVRRRSDDDDLLRRQEEFINANRAGLRRRMRSPTPPRRSLSPRRSPERTRPRVETSRPPPDEESEYRRRMREQEALRERVMRAKEARRRKNAAASKMATDRDRERLDKEKEKDKEPAKEVAPVATSPVNTPAPDTTRTSPDTEPAAEPAKDDQVNSTCENLTPPRSDSPERALTPPLPEKEEKKTDSDDDLDLILGDIDGILSDDDDSGRFKEKAKKEEPPKPVTKPAKPQPAADLRSKLPPKPDKKPRQKIVFHEDRGDTKRKEKSPPRRTVVTSSTKTEEVEEKKPVKTKEKLVDNTSAKDNKMRQRITFDNKKKADKEKDEPKPQFSNRRVILQRKISNQANEKSVSSVFTRIEVKTDPTKPNPGIFSRAVRTAIGTDKNRLVVKKDEPQIEYESGSDLDEDMLLEEEVGNIAVVSNLPHGMTDTRLKTLAGTDVQNINLDKEERSAKLTFKTTVAAETFKKKFNNKMVAASRLTVVLR